jgi:hypothetical protein
MKLIEIIISPNGETQLSTKGFAGAECRQASQFLEQALGTRTSEQLTGECYQPAATQQAVQEGA